MARFFNAADTQYGLLSFPASNTMSCSMWVKADVESGMIFHVAATLGASLNTSMRRFYFLGGGTVRAYHGTNFNINAANATGFVSGEWNHLAFGWSGNGVFMRVNGGTTAVAGGTSGSSAAGSGIFAAVNASNYGGISLHSTIHIAEFAMWNAYFSTATTETYLLSQGYSPLFVRPNNLLVYMPVMGRSAKEPDLIRGGSTGITLYNDPQPSNDHPPIIYPRSGITNVSGLTTVFPPEPSARKKIRGIISTNGSFISI